MLKIRFIPMQQTLILIKNSLCEDFSFLLRAGIELIFYSLFCIRFMFAYLIYNLLF